MKLVQINSELIHNFIKLSKKKDKKNTQSYNLKFLCEDVDILFHQNGAPT